MESLGDQKWWEVFQDKQLQDLIHSALRQNYDVRIAAARILEAQAQVGITRADGLPAISAGAQSVD
jgi:multidrug efflux system outer membrane protein